MIKSELVQRVATANPHLYQRDVENIVNAILGEIVAAMARGDRVELRGFGAFSVKKRPGAHRPQSAHRRPCRQSARSAVPFFKTGKEMRERLNRPIAIGERAGGVVRRSMVRKILRALVLIPHWRSCLSRLAVANRQNVVVSLDPFDRTQPAFSIVLPLYVLILILIIVGVVIGGIAAWLRQSKMAVAGRDAAEARARELKGRERDGLRRRDEAGRRRVPRRWRSSRPRGSSIPPPGGVIWLAGNQEADRARQTPPERGLEPRGERTGPCPLKSKSAA